MARPVARSSTAIAAVAIHAHVAVLHADADFDVLARHSQLQTDLS